MRANVLVPIPETPEHCAIIAGEWSADATTWEEGRNRREIRGMALRRRIEGYGWKTINLPQWVWDKYKQIGKIEEGEMSNLPAVKMESAVVPVSPQEQINQASDMARLLKEVVSKAGLARKLGGRKEHLEFEAWQTIARWHHCTPSTEWTRPIKDGDRIIGWEARVNVLDDQGRIIGSSEGMCMADEQNWRGKPSYALRSMAQTRTAGKALRSLFAHIAVLAGYSPTPAEEMDGVEVREETPKPSAQPQPPPKPSSSDPAMVVEFVPSDLKEEHGEKNGKPWTRYTIFNDAEKYKTFDHKFAEIVRTGEKIRIAYKTDKWGNTITNLSLVDAGDIDQ